MNTFGSRIVVGLGRTDRARAALWWALEEARLRDVPVHLVRTCGPASAERAEAQELLYAVKGWCDRIGSEVEVTTEVAEDGVVPALTTLSSGSSLVVVGTADSWGRDLAFGSVGAGVAAGSRCPVVVVRGDHGREQADDWPVLAAVRSPAEAGPVLEYAAETANGESRPLVVVHAFQTGPGIPLLGTTVDRQRLDRHAWLSRAVAPWQQRYPGLRVRIDIAMDAADRAILERSAHASLVVLGVRRLRDAGALRKHLPPVVAMGRPVELSAAWASTCPVALVPLAEKVHAQHVHAQRHLVIDLRDHVLSPVPVGV
ncbi:MAG: universal stress protein [Actinomycetes bacterium]